MGSVLITVIHFSACHKKELCPRYERPCFCPPWSWLCLKISAYFPSHGSYNLKTYFRMYCVFSTYTMAGHRQKSEQNILAIKNGWSEIKVHVDPNLATAFNFKWVLGNALACKKRGRGIPKVYGFWQPLYTSFSPITHVTFTHFVRLLLNGYCKAFWMGLHAWIN